MYSFRAFWFLHIVKAFELFHVISAQINCMSISLEFIDFVVPIALIKAKYPGGWERFLIDYDYAIGKRVWFDEYLFRDGAMSPNDIELLVQEWTELGFEPYAQRDGEYYWKDCCVVESMFGGPTLPCDWIEISNHTAYLKGTEPGKVIGRVSNEPALRDLNF